MPKTANIEGVIVQFTEYNKSVRVQFEYEGKQFDEVIWESPTEVVKQVTHLIHRMKRYDQEVTKRIDGIYARSKGLL